jgi:hypothetical protein
MKIIDVMISNSLMLRGILISLAFLIYSSAFSNAQDFAEKPKSGELGNVKVFPNPLNEFDIVEVEFEMTINGVITFSLIDQIGNPYISAERALDYSVNKITIDFSPLGLKPGIYFLRLKHDMKPEKVLKIIKR